MESEIRTVVTFESTAFNMITPRDYFVNPCCFGDALAEWLIRELRKQGMATDEKPGQEDFGWYLNFEAAGVRHTFVIGRRPNGETEAGTWIGRLERKRGPVASILGERRRGIQASAAQVVTWSFAAISLLAVRWIDPPSTAVHIQRRLQAWLHHTPYRERYQFVPLRQISPDLQHAVIAAEDARFYQHHGFDWHEVQIAPEDDLEGGRTRGASTITQQLMKNLFFGTGRSMLRKGAEFTLVPVAEFVLGKRRILEIYLNIIEWGPGIYGAESACRYYDANAARNIGREPAARLAAILPAPLKRRPERMNNYRARILVRGQVGW